MKLRTNFYVWLRKNIEKFVELTRDYGASNRRTCAELGWKRVDDMRLVAELLKEFDAQVHLGNWEGVERRLFGMVPFYSKLDSVQEAFRALEDPRWDGKNRALKKRSRGKRPAKGGQGSASASNASLPKAHSPVLSGYVKTQKL